MPDFSHLLKKPAGEAKKPPALDAGDYQGIIKGWEIGDNNKNKTPYVRFQIGLVGWPESGPTLDDNGTPLDLSKRQMRRDFFLSDDALYRLDEFIKSCGVEASGRGYDEVLPEMIGQMVTAEVGQYMNQQTSEIGNQINKLIGSAG